MTMMINDLSISKELDGKALSTVHGGTTTVGQGNLFGGAIAVGSQGYGNVGDVTLALNVPVGINVATPINLNLPLAIGAFGSTAIAV
jgi:hypothetical protein